MSWAPTPRAVKRARIRIGRALLGGDIHDGAAIRVELSEGDLVVTYDNAREVEDAAA